MEVGGERRCGDGGGVSCVRWEERGMCCSYPPVLVVMALLGVVALSLLCPNLF